MPSFFRLLGRPFGISSRSDQRSARPAHRPPTFERLEDRRLLAADLGASIAGTVFTDQTDNGLTADDALLADVTVGLYRDGGDGQFGGSSVGSDDTHVDDSQTNADGRYRFTGVGVGVYFVQQQPVAGLQQDANDRVQQVVITPDDLEITQGITIDAFETAQSVTASALGTLTESTSTDTATSLGGNRDLQATLTSDLGKVQLRSNGFGTQVLEMNSSSTAQGEFQIRWDGANSDADRDAKGLGGYDLTGDGAYKTIELQVGFDDLPVDVTLFAYSDAQNWSSTTLPLSGGILSSQELRVDFDQFAAGGADGGVNWESLGAFEMVVETEYAGTDLQFEWIGTVGASTVTVDFANLNALRLGDRVWYDANNDGIFDAATESGIEGVVMNLYRDTDGNGVLTSGTDTFIASQATRAAGLYEFGELASGDYIVQVDPANLGAGGVIEGLAASTGNSPVPDPDNDVDHDNNGAPLTGLGVVAKAVTLTAHGEPVNDGDANADTNQTIDFGFTLFDLSIQKNDNPDPVVAGEPLTYTLVVTNDGPADAADVTVTDPLPSGIVVTDLSASQGTVVQQNGTITAVLGTLAAGETATVTLVADVQPDAPGLLQNEAAVTGRRVTFGAAPVNDPFVETNLSNNQDNESTVVRGEYDLAIVKTDAPDPIEAGGELTYTLVVTNNGPSDTQDVIVIDALPDEVSYVSSSTTKGSTSETNETVTANLGYMAVGESVTITIVTIVDATAEGEIVNEAIVEGKPVQTLPGALNVFSTETNLDNNEDDAPTLIEAPKSSISGYVYIDRDDDGARDGSDVAIAGVAITLTGTDVHGNSVLLVQETNGDGYYLFSDLVAGTYTVTEEQPPNLNDGKDSPGYIEGSTQLLTFSVADDTFADIGLNGGLDAVEFNFGELSHLTSKREFLASS